MHPRTLRGHLATAAGAAVVFMVLTEGRLDAWWVGVPAVGLAVAARAALTPSRGRLRLSVLPGLAAAFVGGSIAGALDVSRRVLDPRLPIDPALLRHDWRLAPGPARTVLAGLLNLTPGTIAAWTSPRVLWVHALDRRRGPVDVAAWEERVGRLTAEPTETTRPRPPRRPDHGRPGGAR